MPETRNELKGFAFWQDGLWGAEGRKTIAADYAKRLGQNYVKDFMANLLFELRLEFI